MKVFLSFILFCITNNCIAQETIIYIQKINTIEQFKEAVKKNPKKDLIDIAKYIPEIHIDMPYATKNNFTGVELYKHPKAYLHIEPAKELKNIENELLKKGLTLKIFDAYRPYNITCKMWQLTPNRHYVANPKKGSNHNRGIALDLTITDINTGKELDMGTNFDNFTDSAHHGFQNISIKAKNNRKLLKDIMNKHGFRTLEKEWWHYTWQQDIGYEIMDLGFDEIAKIEKTI